MHIIINEINKLNHITLKRNSTWIILRVVSLDSGLRWWASVELSSLISTFREIFILQRYLLDSSNHFHIWRVSSPHHCSWAVSTPVKYERDIQLITSVSAMVKDLENNETEKISLVMPGDRHPEWVKGLSENIHSTLLLETPNLRYIIVTSSWTQWRLKSPASRSFAQPFVQAQIKGNILSEGHSPVTGV